MSGWDEGLYFWQWRSDKLVRELQVPSAEDEYLASLEPAEPDHSAELILALSILTDKQRFAIECRYGFRNDGVPMEMQEIADLMGVSQPAVTKLIQRGLDRMYEGLCESPNLAGIFGVAEQRKSPDRNRGSLSG